MKNVIFQWCIKGLGGQIDPLISYTKDREHFFWKWMKTTHLNQNGIYWHFLGRISFNLHPKARGHWAISSKLMMNNLENGLCGRWIGLPWQLCQEQLYIKLRNSDAAETAQKNYGDISCWTKASKVKTQRDHLGGAEEITLLNYRFAKQLTFS